MKIALVGYARSGKDTVAQMIKDQTKVEGWNNTSTFAFAAPMKRMFHEIFPDVPLYPKPREGYEKFGQAMRDIDGQVWVNAMARNIEDFDIPGFNLIITDVRHLNEAAWCRENGFKIVKVVAKDDYRRARAENETAFYAVNNSERDIWMIDYDWLIVNNGTLEDLERKVAHMIESLSDRPEYDEFPL